MSAEPPTRSGVLPVFLRRLPDTKVGLLVILAALAPVIYIALRWYGAARDVPYWDELDTVIAFLLHLDDAASWRETLAQFFALNNEHRMLTSRLLYALSFWLTGTVNFSVLGAVGNLTLCALCAVLIASVRDAGRRLWLLALLAFLLFSLAHAENFLWSGSSIDHFQVVLLAGASLVALTRSGPRALAVASLLAALATFTLAHGLAVWPVGAVFLVVRRRWRDTAVWCAVALAVAALFLSGFAINSGHRVGDFSPAGLLRIGHFWLVLLGAPLALNHLAFAPWLGALLLGLIAWRARPGRREDEPWVRPVIAWTLLALLMVAVGRANLANGFPNSRYFVLGALAWALALFLCIDALPRAWRTRRALLAALPVLALFNIASNLRFDPMAASWATARDAAADSYVFYQADGHTVHRLHPTAGHATRLLQEAERRGLYRIPRMSLRSEKIADDQLRPSPVPMTYYVERIQADARGLIIDGWAAFPRRSADHDSVRILLQRGDIRHVFTTAATDRPDVAAAYPDEDWRRSGFRFEHYWPMEIAPGEYQLGLAIDDESGNEFVMTDHRVTIPAHAASTFAVAPATQ